MSKMPFAEMMRLSQIMIRAAQAVALRNAAKSLEPHADETMQVSELIELLNMRADRLTAPAEDDGAEHHMEPPC